MSQLLHEALCVAHVVTAGFDLRWCPVELIDSWGVRREGLDSFLVGGQIVPNPLLILDLGLGPARCGQQ
jgi:hypothetical protein